MERSSRSRLTEYTVGEFPGDTLHDALGRVVSRAACLPRKEFFEAWEVARRVRRTLRGAPVLEVAGGHGLLSWILLLLDASCPQAVCVDRRRPASAERLERALLEAWPRLAGRMRYLEADLREAQAPPGGLVVGVHACGRLTDRALDLALEARSAVAVLPCCQSKRTSPTLGLEGWLEERLAVDVARAVRLEQAGYRVRTLTIPADITPANRLLIGEPRNHPPGSPSPPAGGKP